MLDVPAGASVSAIVNASRYSASACVALREPGGDLSLQRELATAYQKVGQVQGDTGGSNLGDPAGALVSYRKALAARQAIARADPRNVEDRVALAASLRRLCGLQLLGFGDVGPPSRAVDLTDQIKSTLGCP